MYRGHDFLRAVVGEGHDAAALGHQRAGGAGQRHQRIDADVERDAEALAAGVGELALQLFGGREGDAVYQRVEFAVARLQLLEQLRDLFVAADIALKGLRIGQRRDQVIGFLLQALVLVGDGQLRPGLLHLLRNGPGNAAFVGHAEHHHRTAV